MAQNVQEGINHLYAQRYQSAKTVFEKMLASNPNNIEATYWLGQAHLLQKNTDAAKSLYDKALASSNNAPLIMVGSGHVALLEGKSADARQKFETAINASKGRKGNDPAILNAVGRANVAAYSDENKLGDLDYAISKLKEASQLAPTNADIFINLGNAYRKKGGSGGEAIQAYRQASTINPSLAIASYRSALLYKTQVSYKDAAAWGVVLDNLNEAIKADPKFAPAYEELYYYNLFAKQDYATAENYSKQFISNADPSVENDYLNLQALLLQKKFSEASAIGKNIISQTNNNPNPRVFRTMAFISMGLKDTATACNYVDQFFAKATDEDVLGSDYILKAQTCGRNNPEMMRTLIFTAVQKDSVLSRQIRLINDAIDDAKTNGQQVFIAELRTLSYQLRQAKGSPTSPTELISYMTIPFYLGGAYERADSIAGEYIKLAPDSIYGYYWGARAKAAIDTGANPQGLAVPYFQKSLDIALTDTVRYKPQGVTAASSLAIYYANVKKDYAAAKDYAVKGLRFDPTNANLININNVLDKIKKPAGTQQAGGSTPQRTNGSAPGAGRPAGQGTAPGRG
ncbi:MAG TPA: tetratricopeptide repeat protein [Flavisolibacter sp.]|nr:tetratricopeptide repeat protein [Flavisolibacter sp.]